MKSKKLLASILVVSLMLSTITTVAVAGSTVTPTAWDGTSDTDWYNSVDDSFTLETAEELAGLAKLVDDGNTFAGITIKLNNDIDLGGQISFDPIGDKSPFKGIFDGNGHTISNLYQSGWAFGYEWGSYGSIGLFGEVENAIIKNVNIKGAYAVVEGGDIGGITGSATGECTFENITISDSGFGTYNNGLGGIIGWSGDGIYTFKNINIKSDVTLGGLWGSFDSSIGGIVGQGEPGATYNFENVNIECRLDVYNDVIASYKYYLYRMCGMIIGRLSETTNIDGTNYPDMSKYNIDCKNVTVTYGDWANYHYCVVAGKTAWRVEAGFEYGGIPEGHDHSTCAMLHNTLIPFEQLFGGSQYGVRGLPSYNGVTVINNALVARSVARIDDTYYLTLNDALDAAEDDDVIDLMGNTVVFDTTINADKNITIKNGTLDASGKEFVNGFGVSVGAGETVKFEDVDFILDNAKARQGFFYIWGAGTVEFVGGSVKANGTDAAAIFHGGEADPEGTFIIDGTTVELSNLVSGSAGGRGFLYPTVDIDNASITMTGLTDNAMRSIRGTITDSTVLVDGVEYGLKNTDTNDVLSLVDTTFTVKNAKNKTENAGIYLSDATLLSEVNDSVVNSQIYIPATTENIAETVSIQFVATDDESVYEIYVVAQDDTTINRLSTAQLKFALESSDDISYKLTPAAGVVLTTDVDDSEVYLYNFDGLNVASKTGEKILIGTVKFEGVGSFEFGADDSYAEAKVTTASLSDNIVMVYNVNGVVAENLGILDLSTSTTGTISLAEATRTVNVNIAFNNAIKSDNTSDYNGMTVTVVGGPKGETHTAKVGATIDNIASFEFEVTAGYRYTITVEGAGYRTARYSTVISEGTDDLVLNFWNNVKDELTVVEIGKDSSAAKVTFLAGDIVKDNKINIYDLSAVVSYFGTENLSASHPEYVKYDLNRDGKIDSKDVAYVLVSWGN